MCSRVATHIYNAFGSSKKDGVYYVFVHACTRRVGNNHIRPTIALDKRFIQHFLHVARKEKGILNAVECGINLGIFDSFRYVFDTNHLSRLFGNKLRNRAGTCIEVKHQFRARQSGKIARHFVELIRLLGIGLIKRFGPHLKPQILHFFDDMVVARIRVQFEVANRIVEFLIKHPDEGCHLRKCLMKGFEQSIAVGRAVLCKREGEHHLSLMVAAEDNRTKESAMRFFVVKRESMRLCIVSDEIADTIVECRHQMTFLDIQHFVETAGDMKTNAIRFVNIVNSASFTNGIPRYPFLIGATEFQLVTIFVHLLRTHDWTDFRQGNFSDAREVVHNLLLLVFELLFVWQNLPFAATTFAIVLACWGTTIICIFYKTLHTRFHKAVFLLCNLQIHNVARNAIGHKHHAIVYARKCLAFCRHTCNLYAFNQRQVFLFSH